jgi:hypothetical protein
MMSYSKTVRRLVVNPFKKNDKKSDSSSKGKTHKKSSNAAMALSKTGFEHSDMSLSPTSVETATLSFTSEITTSIEKDQWLTQRPVSTPYRPALHSCAKPEGVQVQATSCYGYREATPGDMSKYGYGEASPDDKAKYGYEDSAPCREGADNKNNTSDHQYGDAAPGDDEAKYGYADGAAPSGFGSATSRRTPRRSSMKQSGRPRRASIQLCGEVENVLPSSHGEKVRRRTSITFNGAVKVKTVAPVKALTHEPEALWFQDEEFDRMKQKCFEIVDKVDQGLTGGKKYCVRGLEKLSDSKREKVLGRKYDAWNSVLDEQDQQRQSGEFDDGHMANVCKFSTLQNQKEAEERARQDAAEIENYLRTTRRQCRRLSM